MIMDKPTFVKGNVFSLSIPLQRQSVEASGEGAKPVVNDFYPGQGQPVSVILQMGAHREKELAVMEGNFAVVTFQGLLDPGLYAMEILCNDSDGRPCRYKKAAAVEIVDESIKAGLDANVEFDDTPYLMPAAIFPGVVTYNAGGDTVKKVTEKLPVVHRCIPYRPQLGTVYYFESEVLVKMKVDVFKQCGFYELANGKSKMFATHNGWLLKEGSEPEEGTIIIHMVVRCELVKITEDLLDEQGCISLAALIDKVIVAPNNFYNRLTSLTASPQFTIENGHVVCKAHCTLDYVRQHLAKIKIFSNYGKNASLEPKFRDEMMFEKVKSNKAQIIHIHKTFGIKDDADEELDEYEPLQPGTKILFATGPMSQPVDIRAQLVGEVKRILGHEVRYLEDQDMYGVVSYYLVETCNKVIPVHDRKNQFFIHKITGDDEFWDKWTYFKSIDRNIHLAKKVKYNGATGARTWRRHKMVNMALRQGSKGYQVRKIARGKYISESPVHMRFLQLEVNEGTILGRIIVSK